MSYAESWGLIEAGILSYLTTALSVPGAQSYTFATFPRNMPSDAAAFYILGASLNGGAVTVFRQSRDEVVNGEWHMNGEIKALCSDDATALSLGGQIMDALPIDGTDVAGVGRGYVTEFPSRAREVIRVENADRAGDERVFFALTVPISVAFGNVSSS